MGLTGQNQPGLFGSERTRDAERDLEAQVTRSRRRRGVARVRHRLFRRLFRRGNPS